MTRQKKEASVTVLRERERERGRQPLRMFTRRTRTGLAGEAVSDEGATEGASADAQVDTDTDRADGGGGVSPKSGRLAV